MKIVSTSYSKTPEFDDPQDWLKRINFYTGILEELAKQHEVISIERINYEGEYEQAGVHYLFLKQKKNVIHFPWRMHRLIKGLQPDIVLVNGLIFPFQVMQLRRTLGKKAKIIILHRAEKPSPGIKKYLQKQADKSVNAYLFSSSEFKEQWKKVINEQKIYEVMQASSVFALENNLASRATVSIDGDPYFLWAGRLNENKDPLTVIRAFSEYLPFHRRSRLYMVYQSEELLDTVLSMINNRENLKQAISLVGKVPHEQMQRLYRITDFFISSSHYEGGGTVVSEAMSCGCIPIVTNITSFRSITGRGKCGLLYEPGNEKELLSALLKTNEMDLEKERNKVLQQFKEELSFEAIATKIEKVIASLNKEINV